MSGVRSEVLGLRLQIMLDPISLQLSWSPFTFATVSPFQGVAFFRFRGDGFQIKAPWDEPLFSERNGYRIPLINFLGWRVFPLRAEEMIGTLVRTEECSTRRF
jgi:hypothetical protein